MAVYVNASKNSSSLSSASKEALSEEHHNVAGSSEQSPLALSSLAEANNKYKTTISGKFITFGYYEGV